MLRVAGETAERLAAQKEQAEELPSGLKILYTEKAEGVKPAEGSKITMNYAGYLENGTLFDSNIEEVAKKYNVWDHRRKDAGGSTLTSLTCGTPMWWSTTRELVKLSATCATAMSRSGWCIFSPTQAGSTGSTCHKVVKRR